MSQHNDKILYVFKATIRQEVVATSYQEAVEKLDPQTVTADMFDMTEYYRYDERDTTEER
jgi:hypothetical protein